MSCLWLSKRWERDTRYYEAHLKQDLFGWVVVRNWGRRNAAQGQIRTTPVDSYGEGLKKLNEIHRKRAQREYQPCTIH